MVEFADSQRIKQGHHPSAVTWCEEIKTLS
jgi:hypothetical protein